ncbi:hypothetical protein HYFRA_00004708 [Hymenoscyphus fraxineus]|uniref:Uncharacterized protein n=1 Tax=Hymenoscyphus fraxineus TaxID=746836 RepID=A0A9N9KXU8_9HELO|nr:hypothetical protein HYFRA_00004708 [Hymenoscyphus fraxineus]
MVKFQRSLRQNPRETISFVTHSVALINPLVVTAMPINAIVDAVPSIANALLDSPIASAAVQIVTAPGETPSSSFVQSTPTPTPSSRAPLPKKAVIGISVSLSVTFLFFMLGIWIYRRQRAKQASREEITDEITDEFPRALGYKNELPGEDQRVEIDGRMKVSELHNEKRVAHELSGVKTAVELPAHVPSS